MFLTQILISTHKPMFWNDVLPEKSRSCHVFKWIQRFLVGVFSWISFTFQIALNQSMFELGKCSFHKNCLECFQNFIGNVFWRLCRQNVYNAGKLLPYWVVSPLELIGAMWWPTLPIPPPISPHKHYSDIFKLIVAILVTSLMQYFRNVKIYKGNFTPTLTFFKVKTLL